MGLQPLYGKGSHLVLWARLQAVRGKISDTPNCLNYCETFIIYTQFTNVAAGSITQPGGLWVGDQWCKM
jgi:hypothetical protein